MSCRMYYTCKNCGFEYMDVNYYFCFRNDTGVIEKYESLFSTVNYADGSIIRGRVIQHYCKNCDKIVSVYQTGKGSSLFTRESTIDFLRESIPMKKEKVLKTSVLLKRFVDMLNEDASLSDLNDFLEEHDKDLYYKINLDDYIDGKAFKSMDFYLKDYLSDELANELDTLHSLDISKVHSDDLKLKQLHDDLSSYFNELSAKDLNRNELDYDISRNFDYIGDYLKGLDKEIICINYFGDEFNITLDGKEIEEGTCPECGEEFYDVSPLNPCPKCGQKKIKYDQVFYD